MKIEGIKIRNNRLYSLIDNKWVSINTTDINYDTKQLNTYIYDLRSKFISLTTNMKDTSSGERLNKLEDDYKIISESETIISEYKTDEGKVLRVENVGNLQDNTFLDIFDEEEQFIAQTNEINELKREKRKPKKITVTNAKEEIKEEVKKEKKDFYKVVSVRKGRINIADVVIFMNKNRRIKDASVYRSKALEMSMKDYKVFKCVKLNKIVDKVKEKSVKRIKEEKKVEKKSDKTEKVKENLEKLEIKKEKKKKEKKENKPKPNLNESEDEFVNDDLFEGFNLEDEVIGYSSTFMNNEEDKNE